MSGIPINDLSLSDGFFLDVRCSWTLVPCIRSHESAGHMVVWVRRLAIAGPRGDNTWGRVHLPPPPTIAFQSRRQVPCIVTVLSSCANAGPASHRLRLWRVGPVSNASLSSMGAGTSSVYSGFLSEVRGLSDIELYKRPWFPSRNRGRNGDCCVSSLYRLFVLHQTLSLWCSLAQSKETPLPAKSQGRTGDYTFCVQGVF